MEVDQGIGQQQDDVAQGMAEKLGLVGSPISGIGS
jgi:hypothetical protein